MANEEFGEIIKKAILMMMSLSSQKLDDGELSDGELDKLQEGFEACISAIEYERECRDNARQSANYVEGLKI